MNKDIIKERGKWGMRLGLERIESLLDKLGHPEKDLKIIHVAGSNGKGSIVRLLEFILTEAGYTVGTFSSPAMIDDNDRIRLNREMIDDKTLERILNTVLEAADELETETGERATGFELETAIALLFFKEKNADLVVLEVGLGGRLDATNVIREPLLVIITHIALEHTKYLGNTLTQIAREKGAIIKDNSHVIFSPQQQEAKATLEKIARSHHLKSLQTLDKTDIEVLKHSLFGQKVKINQKEYSLKLLGDFQQLNLLTALAAIKALRTEGYTIPEEKIETALNEVYFPGRCEYFLDSPQILIDGAHNLDGIEHLTKNLETYFGDKKHNFIFGMLEEKNPKQALELLLNYAKKIYLLEPDSPEAVENSTLKRIIESLTDKVDVEIVEDYERVFNILEKNSDESFIITGSLYLIKKLRPLLEKLKFKKELEEEHTSSPNT